MNSLLDYRPRARWAALLAWLLVPAALLGLVAWYALRGERAAVERELAAQLAREVHELPLRIDALLRADAAAFGQGRRESCALADYVALDNAARIVEPRHVVPTPLASGNLERARATAVPNCELLAREFRVASGPLRASTFARLAAECPEARGESGRAIVPTALLADPALVNLTALADWLYEHGETLTPAERQFMLTELETSTIGRAETTRLRAELNAADLTLPALTQLFERDDVRSAAQLLSAGNVHIASYAGARVVMVRTVDGGVRASAVTRASLARPGALAALQIPTGLHAALAGTPSAMPPGDVARVSIAPELALELVIAPGTADARTARTRLLLVLAIVLLMAVVLGLVLRAERQMRKARALADLRVDFGAALAHELRTPTAALGMLAELLKDGKVEPADQAEVFGSLSLESQRLRNALERMLSLRRMLSPNATAMRERADLAAVVREVVARKGSAQIELELAAGEWSIDEQLVVTALENLLDNARKYGEAPFGVQLLYRDGTASLAVTSGGARISNAAAARIFEPFNRGSRDRVTSDGSGLGIGLALVAWCARAHGGKALLRATPHGNQFVLELPAAPGSSS